MNTRRVPVVVNWSLSPDQIHYVADYDVYRFGDNKRSDDGVVRSVRSDVSRVEAEEMIRVHYKEVFQPNVDVWHLTANLLPYIEFRHIGSVPWEDS